MNCHGFSAAVMPGLSGEGCEQILSFIDADHAEAAIESAVTVPGDSAPGRELDVHECLVRAS